MNSKILSAIIASTIFSLPLTPLIATPSNSNDASTLSNQQQQITWLGIYLNEVSPALQAQLGELVQNGGVMVQKVQQGSPAQKADLRTYDIITQVDGIQVTQSQQLYAAIKSKKPQQTIKLTLVRQGKKMDINATLGERSIPNQQAIQPQTPLNQQPGNYFWGVPQNWPFNHQAPNWPNFNMPAMPSMPAMPNFQNIQPNMKGQNFSQSESLSMKTLPNGKMRIETQTTDSDGNSKEFVFEGDPEEIKKQIQENKDLSKEQKDKLLNSFSFTPGTFFNNNIFNQQFHQGFGTNNTTTPSQPKGSLY